MNYTDEETDSGRLNFVSLQISIESKNLNFYGGSSEVMLLIYLTLSQIFNKQKKRP